MTLYADNGHWQVFDCPEKPGERLHVHALHLEHGQTFPECWTPDALASMSEALVKGLMQWMNEPLCQWELPTDVPCGSSASEHAAGKTNDGYVLSHPFTPTRVG